MSRPPAGSISSDRVKLWETKAEREIMENHADLFAILKTTEKLERAWTQDIISAADYEVACTKLIAQFKTLWGTLQDTVPDVAAFARQHSMQCSFALKRLVESGVPATVEHGRGAPSSSNNNKAISDTTAAFITCLDQLKVGFTAVDQALHYPGLTPVQISPELSNLLSSLNRVPSLSPDMEGKTRVKVWLSKLNAKTANYELSTDELRQLEHDIVTSFNEWNDCL